MLFNIILPTQIKVRKVIRAPRESLGANQVSVIHMIVRLQVEPQIRTLLTSKFNLNVSLLLTDLDMHEQHGVISASGFDPWLL